ncbi:MAG TPA: asparagine synthase-related protein [Candidatus Acidoferrales bacterium]|nr:asparagine synthase-related protein [Candidatus Acidoferrales bacterium]
MSDVQEIALRELGLRSCLDSQRVHLFASEDTSVLVLSNDRVLIGHLFDRSGRLVRDGSGFLEARSNVQFAEDLLQNYWGEYIAICHAGDRAHELTILREPSGGMPAIYAVQEGTGFVTSDISIAIELGLYKRQVDWTYITTFLAFPNLKTATTALDGVRELLPGCSLRLRGAQSTTQVYWSPWNFVASSKRFSDPRDAADAIRSTVLSVVKAWADVDRTILLELSGGLDSSIVAVCLQAAGAHVTCCTLTTTVPGADERQYAGLMAKQLAAELDTRNLDFESARFNFPPPPHTVVPGMMPLQYAVDLAMQAAGSSHDIASHFTGGGGDTVFCYLGTAAPAADAFLEVGIGAGLAAVSHLSLLHNCTFWKAARVTAKKLLRRPKPPYKADLTFLAPSIAPGRPNAHPWLDQPRNALPGDRERIADLVGTQMFRDSSPRGQKRWHRMPLLSQPVVETCLRTPSWMTIADGRNRAVARNAFADLLPPEVLHRRSKGTFMSYSGAVYQRNKVQLREFLLSGALQQHRLLDVAALQQFFKTDLPPRDDSFMRVFELSMIENWVRHQV